MAPSNPTTDDARRLQQAALEEVNARAQALQARDNGDAQARGRFRCGAFIYVEEPPKDEEQAP
ncbi:MAG: hypothetical protein RIC87_19470 [Kiloniellales bacterium]